MFAGQCFFFFFLKIAVICQRMSVLMGLLDICWWIVCGKDCCSVMKNNREYGWCFFVGDWSLLVLGDSSWIVGIWELFGCFRCINGKHCTVLTGFGWVIFVCVVVKRNPVLDFNWEYWSCLLICSLSMKMILNCVGECV